MASATYYLTADGHGYTPDGTLPTGAVACTHTQAQGGYKLSNGKIVTVTLSVAQAKAQQNAAILAAAQAALRQVVAAYPDLEVSTWPQQLAEATAYTASNTAATPMLSAIATASGETVAALAANVMAKAATYQADAGAVVGKRIKLMTQISNATTVAAIRAVVW